jgi:nitroreductase
MSDENIFTDIPKLSHSENAQKTNPQEFNKVIQSRRSVRVYDASPIPESVVREVLQWSLLAPNSSNLQPWEIYWVRTPKNKAKLVEACFSQPAARTAAELFVFVGRIDTWKQNRQQMLKQFDGQKEVPASARAYYQKLVPFVYSMGPLGIFGPLKALLFFILGFFKVVPREPTSIGQLKLWAAKSTALACENFMLGMSAHGFDTCPMEGLDSARVRKLLGLPCSATIVMAISAGKRAPGGVYGPRLRFPSEQFIKEI